MRVVVVDDEAPARSKLRRYISELSDWQLLAECASVADAVETIQSLQPDLALLDIELGDGTGFDIVEQLLNGHQRQAMPEVVFITAYDAHAVRAFEVNAHDYLLKPVDRNRFTQMVQRVEQRATTDTMQDSLKQVMDALHQPAWPQRIVVEKNERGIPLPVKQISVLEADRNYVVIHTCSEQFRIRSTLSQLGQRLDPNQFAQVNRSAWVRIDAIAEIQRWFRGDRMLVMNNGRELRAGRRFLQAHPVLRELKR